MENKRNYTLPLEELLALIKASGYELTIQQILDVQVALLSVSISSTKLATLKHLITPVIAKNDEEQGHLHHLIDAYVAEKTKHTATTGSAFGKWLQQHKQLVFGLKITAFVLIATAGILLYLHNEKKKKAPPKTVTAAVNKDTAATPAPATAPAAAINSDSSLSSTAPAPEKAKQQLTVTTQHSNRLIVPEAIDFNLQMSVFFGALAGIALAWMIFYEQKRKMDMKQKFRSGDAFFIKRTKDKMRPTGSGFEPEGEMAQPVIRFSEKNYLIQQPRTLQKIRSHLKKPAAVQNPAFDIKASITKSVRNAGLASLVHTSEWKDRKYLFLIDSQHPEAHTTSLLHYLVQSIHAGVTNIVRYYFSGDASRVQDANGNATTLASLVYQYGGHHLIIVGNGYGFFESELSLIKKPLSDAFQNWSSRAIITPTPLPYWSQREAVLQKANFQLVPADIEAVELLAKGIAEEDAVTQSQFLKKLPALYSVAVNDFHSVAALKEYLNNEQLFQMVCALAVYPRLQWDLTVALFYALDTAELTYELLLKVARIPWLHTDKLDDNIRLQLLTEMTPETEVIARETIIGLLSQEKPNIIENSPAFLELNTQFTINAFLLYTHDQYKYRKYSGTKETMIDYWNGSTEWALKEYVDRSGKALLPRYKSKQGTVEDFLLQERQFDKWNISFSKLVYVTLPAIVLYIVFAAFKPAFVYPSALYKNVSFAAIIEKDTFCYRRLPYVINSTNGKSDTFYLGPTTKTDTILINDMKYNNMVNLEIWMGDNEMQPVSFPAIDSFFVVTAKCN